MLSRELGIPMLKRALENTDLVIKEYKKESKKELQRNAEAALLSNKLENIELKIQTHNKEKDELINILNEYSGDLSELQEKLDDSAEAMKLIEAKTFR